jgi:hypothetical protein
MSGEVSPVVLQDAGMAGKRYKIIGEHAGSVAERCRIILEDCPAVARCGATTEQTRAKTAERSE